ncbi:MAG: nuclear transport factor 2 family protein [Cyclobacteriaceae bacterium]
MMKYISIHFIVVLLTCLTSCGNEGTNSLEEAIHQFNSAFQQADVEKLSSLITDNYLHTNGSWESFGREKWLGYLRERKMRIESGELRIDRYELTDIKIIKSLESAFVTGKIIMEGIENGKFFVKEIRVSNYWILLEGDWKRAGFHDTVISE